GADAIAAEQLALFPNMMSEEDAAQARREILSADPRIEIVKQLLSSEECDYLIRRGEPLLKPSMVDDPASGWGKLDSIRTSHGAAFLPHDEALVIRRLNRRLAIASRPEVGHGEPLGVLRCTPRHQHRLYPEALAGT